MGSSSLTHWGIRGMRWGVRRYQNEDGSLTPAGRERYGEPGAGERRGKGSSKWKKIAKGAAIGLGTAAAVGGAAYLYNRYRRNGGSRLALPSGRLGLPSPNSAALAVRGNNSLANIGSRAIGAARTRPGMEYVGRKVREEREKRGSFLNNARAFAGRHSGDIGDATYGVSKGVSVGLGLSSMRTSHKARKLYRDIMKDRRQGKEPDKNKIEQYNKLRKKAILQFSGGMLVNLGAVPLSGLAKSGARAFSNGGRKSNSILSDYKDFTVSDITDLVPTGGNEPMTRRR